MTKEELEAHLERSSEMPLITNQVREVADIISSERMSRSTKEMVYDMLDIIVQLGERIHAMEWRNARHTLWEESSAEFRKRHYSDPDKEQGQ